MPIRKTIVIVGMLNSVHLARWVTQFAAEPIDFVLIPSTPTGSIHPLIVRAKDAHTANGATFNVATSFVLHSKAIWVLDKVLGLGIRGRIVARILSSVEANFVHILEFQHAGYLFLDSLRRNSRLNAEVIVTNYGSDIYWFRQYPRDLKKIKDLLAVADRYSAECQRDVDLAVGYGFKGRVLPVIPNAGGFSTNELSINTDEAKRRKKIMIKGYDGWVGRARLALDAVERIQDELQAYEIVVYSADRSTVRRVRELQKRTKLRISLYRKNALTHDEMLDHFRSSKLYLGVSLSDGISTSLLEALVSGCVPIQTFTACTDGWFMDGEEGVVLRDFEADTVVEAIRSGIQIADNFDREKRAGLQSRLSAKLLDETIFDLARTYYAD
jgi:hypothetical protein